MTPKAEQKCKKDKGLTLMPIAFGLKIYFSCLAQSNGVKGQCAVEQKLCGVAELKETTHLITAETVIPRHTDLCDYSL